MLHTDITIQLSKGDSRYGVEAFQFYQHETQDAW